MVRVQRTASDVKNLLCVLAVTKEYFLALVTDDALWAGLDVALLRSGLTPALQDTVVVMGNTVGGENICITARVISRIDMSPSRRPVTFSRFKSTP